MKIKKILKWLAIVVGISYLLFIIIAPPIVEAGKNKVTNPAPYKASNMADKLLKELDFVGDLHCDALLWDRKLYKKYDYGHVDFPRMVEGHVAFQAFTIVTKSPAGQNFEKNSAETMDMITPLSIGQGQPPNTWFSLTNRALYQCKKLHSFAQQSKTKFIIVKSKADIQELLIERKKGLPTIGGMLGIEGGHCLEGKIENLERIYKAGVRMLGPTHFFDNELGGSAHGETGGGLTSFGKAVIVEMEKMGMIIDVAHSSEAVVDDILELYSGPILTSHSGVDGTLPSSRNLSDKHLKAIAAKSGIIGIAFFPGAIGPDGIKGIVDAMSYTKQLIGTEHVALGSDFDGSVTTPFDVTGYALLIDEMLKQGYSNAEITAIMGGNLKRFLLKHL